MFEPGVRYIPNTVYFVKEQSIVYLVSLLMKLRLVKSNSNENILSHGKYVPPYTHGYVHRVTGLMAYEKET